MDVLSIWLPSMVLFNLRVSIGEEFGGPRIKNLAQSLNVMLECIERSFQRLKFRSLEKDKERLRTHFLACGVFLLLLYDFKLRCIFSLRDTAISMVYDCKATTGNARW